MDSVGSVRAVTASAWQWLRALPPPVILAAGWTVFILYAFPGLMTMDSFDQLQEGRDWLFTDSHPPAMAALWGIVDRIVAGPIGMLVIQSLAFLAGLYLILRRAMRPRRAAICACVVFLFPPIVAPMAVIWKDCLMAGFLVLGLAAMFDERRWVRILGLGALSVATAMRYNAPAATLPLVVLLFEWSPAPWLRRYAIAAAAWIAVTAAAFGVNAVLVDRPMHLWQSSLALMDIAGTLAHVEPDLSDDVLRGELAPTGILIDHDIHAAIRARYAPANFEPLIVGPGHLWDVPIRGTTPAPEWQRDAITRAWTDLVPSHPAAYAMYRLETFGEAIGLNKRFLGATVMEHRTQLPQRLAAMHLRSGTTRLQDRLEGFNLSLAKRTRLFRPHVYLLLALLLGLGVLVFCRQHRDVLALLASGIAMELSLVPLVPSPDYRYSHWLVVCTCVALVMLIGRRAWERTGTATRA